MFVQFTKTLPGSPHKVGETVEFPDGVGRSYVDGEYAKEVSVVDHLRSQMAAEMAGIKTDLTQALTEAVRTVPKPPAYQTIEPGEASGDRDQNGRSGQAITPGELVRALYWARSVDDERITDGMRDHARARLKSWEKQKQAEQTQWVDRSMDHVSGDNPHGVARDGSESTNGAPTYGYLVRPGFGTDVFRIESETDVFTGLRQIPTGSAVEFKHPALDQYSTSTPTNRASNLFGGVTLYRKPEDQARTPSDARLSEIIFKITDLTAMTKVSRDLLADSYIDLNSYLQSLFREAFGWRRDYDFLYGSGVGEPLGILDPAAAAVIRGGGVSGGATRAITGKIVYEDLAWMISRIWPAARQGMYWILNAQAASQLQAIKDAGGTGYVFQPNSMVSQAMAPSIYQGGTWDGVLMGFPVKLSEKAPALNTTGDLTLFSPRYYGEATRAGLEVGITEHRYWETDQVGIRWKLRNDGRPMMKGPIKGADGNTYSFCSTLVQL